MCEIRSGHPDARRSLIQPSSCFLLAVGMLLTPLAFSDDPVAPPDLTVDQPVIPSAIDLEAQRKAFAENAALDEATRARIDELYGKAISRLTETGANDTLRQKLAAELEAASELLAEKQHELESFVQNKTESLTPEGADFDFVSQKLAEAQTLVTSQRVALDGVVAEITRRLARRKLIPSLLSESQKGLESVEKELAAVAPADEPAELTAARLMLLQIRKQFLQSQRLLCEQESQTYEPTQRLWTTRRDLAERQFKDAERVVAALQDRLAQIRRQDASAAAREARMVAADAHPAVADMAARNAELAEESQVILRSLEQTRGEISKATELKNMFVLQ